MLLDAQNLFSDDQSVALALSATALSTNTIDLGATSATKSGVTFPADIGRGNAPEIVAQVTADVVGAGASIQVQVITADDAALTSNVTVVNQSAPIGVASLKSGYQFRVAITPGIAQRYLGVRYVNSGAATTAGTVTAGLVIDRQTASI